MLALLELCEISMVSSDKWPRLYQSCQNTKDVKYTRVSGWMGFLYPWSKFIIQFLITSSFFWKHISRVLTKSLNSFLTYLGQKILVLLKQGHINRINITKIDVSRSCDDV